MNFCKAFFIYSFINAYAQHYYNSNSYFFTRLRVKKENVMLHLI